MYDDFIPHYIAIGVPYNTVMHLSPKKLKVFDKSYDLQRDIEDEKMWYLGMYIENAVFVAVEHCLAGKKASSEYLKQPLIKEAKANNPDLMTEEEKLEKVKLLFATLEARKAEFDREKSKGSN